MNTHSLAVGGRKLSLPDGIVEEIRRHAREAYPHECCGALFGRGRVVVEVLALPNMTEEGPRTRFLVRPDDYRAAEYRARQRQAELLASIIPIRITRRGRHSTTWITPGRLLVCHHLGAKRRASGADLVAASRRSIDV